MPNWKKLITSGSDAVLNSLYVTGSITGSRFSGSFTGSLFGSSSYALTASYALNAGANSYTHVQGSPSTTWTINHNLNNSYPVVTVYNNSGYVIIPQNIQTVTANQTVVTFAIATSGNATVAVSGITTTTSSFAQTAISSSYAQTASLLLGSVQSATSASYAATSSWTLNFITSSVTSASFASTASSVNTLNQNVLITGSLTVGLTTTGSSENTLILGPKGTQEGGQLLLYPGTSYTSASMLDVYQDSNNPYLRILRGSVTSSDAIVAQFNLHTKQFLLPAYNSLGAFSGTPVAALGVDSNGAVITIQTGSQAGGSGVTINNNSDNYILTATGTANTINGESNLQFNGSTLSVTGNISATSITSSGAVIAQANNAMYFRGGDDAELWDINVVNTVGIYGQQDQTVASIKLGSNGGILSGRSGSLGINTTLPVSGTLHVSGNIFATSFTGSLRGTSSWSQNVISSSYSATASVLLGSVQSASYASAISGGAEYYIPVWKSSSTLTSSLFFQSGSYTALRYSGSPIDSAGPDILYIHGNDIDTYNLISAQSDRNGYIQLNVKNNNNSTQASSDIVATADNGTESTNYIDMGINSSGFTNTGNVGGQNDAYVYSTGNDLYIGNASAGKEVIIFNGGLDAAAEAKVWIHDQGTVGINTGTYNVVNPPSLQVNAPNDQTNNIAQFYGNTDNYSQVGITNANSGTTASVDLALYNDIDPTNQLAGYIDLGINSTTYAQNATYPGKGGDSYLFTDSDTLIISSISSSQASKIILSVGGVNEDDNAKLILSADNIHKLTGSLRVNSGAISSSLHGTASWANNAITASYIVTAQTASYVLNAISASYAATSSYSKQFTISGSLTILTTPTYNTSSINVLTYNTSSDNVEYSTINDLTFTKNIINVGLPGSRGTKYNVIKTAVESITDASSNNTYTVRVYPGIYIEDTITVPSWVAIKGDSSISTIVSASNPSQSIFVMSDQSMIIDMQVQGSTGPSASAVYYSSPTTPQTNAIAYVENVRFGTNYTNAMCAGSGSGNCILQCSNVKYGGYTDTVSQKSFDIGFRVSGSGGSIGRMQLRNVTSTNGGVAGTDNNQIFALAEAPGCTFIVNGCLLTRATGTARGTGFKVYNGGQLRLTGVNFQRWINGIWAPQTGSAPSIDAVALNFENCTYDVLIEHTGSTGKVQGTDTFLKTVIPYDAPLYEVGQDQRRITVAKKGGDFTSISASVAYITDSSETNRYVIEVGPGEFIEKTIDLRNKPYISIVGSDIQSTHIMPSGSGNFDQFILGNTNEVSFLSLMGSTTSGYSAFVAQDLDGFALLHKVSIYDWDYGIKVIGNVSSSQLFGEYIDINGPFSYGVYVSASNGTFTNANMENYYLFPSGTISTGNYAIGSGAELDLYTSVFAGDSVSGSTAIYLGDAAILESAGIDIQNWEYGFRVPNIGSAPRFRIVGGMIHNTITYDFYIQKTGTIGRFQGISDHSKINNASEEFYWNFLDDTDGENDVTRKLSVTFADGTHTDATTLIFNGSPMGVMSGGTITISSGLTITTAAGFGYCEDPLDTGVYKRIDWNNSNLTLTANSNNYIYINYNGVLSASGTAPSSLSNIILGRVVTNNTTVEFIDQTPYDGAHMSNKISKFNRDALGPVYADGSIVTENTTPFRLNVTAGSYFFSENNFTPSGGTAISIGQYYPSASTWNTSSITTIPAGKYASGSNLIAMSASYYTKHTLYGVGDGADEKYFLVINSNQYSTLVETENADLPTPPTYFSDGVVSLASIYIQSGSSNITQIQDIRPIIGFRAAGVNASSVHGNLLGLSADDHTQYLLVNGGRQMSGDLGLGGNDIYNFGFISGSSVTSSAAIITNINATTVNATSFTGSLLGNASTATSASYITSSLVYGPNGFNSILSSSYSFSSSYAISSSYSISSSFAISSSRSTTASLAFTASYITGSNVFGPYGSNSIVSASYALTASYALNGGGSSTITIGEEGASQGTATFLNFTGSGVTATVSNSTASIYIPGGGTGGGLTTKSNVVANSSFSGNPKKATVTFTTAFANTNYGVTVTGEDARSWTIESKATTGFVINANSNTSLSGNTFWHAIEYGEG